MKKLAQNVWAGWWWALFHFTSTLLVTVLLSLPVIDWTRVQMLWESMSREGFQLDWARVALHFGLGACAWALIVIVFLLVTERRKRRVDLVLKPQQGTVMVETLIVIVPFLILTSGLAQLAMLNITGILADLAAFQGARAAWVWLPEVDASRSSVTRNNVRDRARTAASMALAPTAPNDFFLGRSIPPGSSNYFRRQRAAVTAAFMNDNTQGPAAYSFSGGPAALGPGGAFGLHTKATALGKDASYVAAFDTTGFKFRAARKMTFAEWGLWSNFNIVDTGNRVGVDFEYDYNYVFPWFGYLWGKPRSVGMRVGYYDPIHRRHTFAKQPSMK